MHKKEFIDGLKCFVDTARTAGEVRWAGQQAFARFFIYYLENLKIPSDEKYSFWQIEPHLPELAVDAFESLRTGTDEETIRFREMYEAETGYEVPNIIDFGESNLFERGSAIQTTLCSMLRKITGQDAVEHSIKAYCYAQDHVVQQTFDKFLRVVYRQGMNERVEKCAKRGMSGKFGKTELRTFTMAGRLMFTFARRKKGETVFRLGSSGEIFHRLPYQEDSVSFIGEDGDPLCLNAGILSVSTDLRTAMDMIEDVIRHWPSAQKGQSKIYKANANVSVV